MASLKIRQVVYHGRNWRYRSPVLDDGLNLLVGPNGAGKTTFSDLVYYALGGAAPKFEGKGTKKHKEISKDEEHYVELKVEIDHEAFVLQRYIGTSHVAVKPAAGRADIEVLPLDRRGDAGTFSDWLLGQLGIEPVTLRQGSRSWTLNFTDLARLLYHNQSPDPVHLFKPPDVANFVTDSSYVRRTIFEVLMGRSNHDLHRVHAEVEGLEEQRDRITAKLDAFAESSSLAYSNEEPKNIDHLRRELDEAEEQAGRLERTIADLSESDETAVDLLEATVPVTVPKGAVIKLREVRATPVRGQRAE